MEKLQQVRDDVATVRRVLEAQLSNGVMSPSSHRRMIAKLDAAEQGIRDVEQGIADRFAAAGA